jgi:hypothetical protein
MINSPIRSQRCNMNNSDALNEYVVKDLFQTELINIIGNNNLNGLKQLISSPTFSILTKEQIDSSAFQVAYFTCEQMRVHESEIIKYLIFDYGIKEENSIDLIKVNVNPFIKQMFQSRNLNTELSVELENTSNRPSKKLKV